MNIEIGCKKNGQFKKWYQTTDYPYAKMRFLNLIVHKYKFQVYKRTNCMRENLDNCCVY